MSDGAEPINFVYDVKFDDGRQKRFTVRLDRDSLDLVSERPTDAPEWTALEFNKCPNCSLDPATSPRCPVAASLFDLIDFFKHSKSFEEVEVRIETEQRDYFKKVPLQTVASSLMGIYMVSAGCPILNKMRPMVETHLPFATWEETTYRVISMYMMAQYFMHKNGGAPDWDLSRLVEFFNEVYEVNNAFFNRLGAVRYEDGDANLNAVTILNAGVNITAMSIEADDLKHWEDIFMAHWPT